MAVNPSNIVASLYPKNPAFSKKTKLATTIKFESLQSLNEPLDGELRQTLYNNFKELPKKFMTPRTELVRCLFSEYEKTKEVKLKETLKANQVIQDNKFMVAAVDNEGII